MREGGEGQLTIVFVVCSLNLSKTFSKTNFSLIPGVSTSLFVHILHLQALVNVNIAFEFLGVTIQSKAVRSTTKDFSRSLGRQWQLVEN